jgi:anti-anti-sigma factor
MNELAEVEAADLEDARVVRVSGEIDLSNAHDVLESIGEAVRSGATAIIVDLSGVTFLDSSGISMLFRLRERIGYSRQDLCLVVPPTSPIRRVLDLTRVSDVIPLHDSLDR